jgi:beta-glucanase (GH16 family)
MASLLAWGANRGISFMITCISRRRMIQALGCATGVQAALPRLSWIQESKATPGRELSWHPEQFPEMIVKSWYQEDVDEGEVTAWRSRGIKPAVAEQSDSALRPLKLHNNNGVLFRKGMKQALTWAVDADAPYLHRWWLAIVRCDLANANRPDVSVLSVNGSEGGPNYRQPRIFFKVRQMSLMSELNDGQFKIEGGTCSPDFSNWNVIVGYRRGSMMQAVVNGIKSKGQTIYALAPTRVRSGSFFGDANAPMGADVAIDCMLIGQSELNDAQIDKLTGWAMWRVGQQSALPDHHPYKRSPPRGMDRNDQPSRYIFDERAWVAIHNTERYFNRGRPAPAVDGYTTVFFDDFTENTVVDDLKGAPGSNWYAPTHLVGIGGQAKAQRRSNQPSSYVHDPANHTLALRLLHNNVWKTGAFSSVNNNGQGRFWGKGIFEIRAKMPALPAPRPGFFPAFWAYGREHLFWRTRNRLECDFWEYDGSDGTYINITQHVHKPVLNSHRDPGILMTDVRYKIAGYRLDLSSDFPRTIDIYDGEFHTWYAQIENDYSYFVIDGYEVARVPTTPELKAPKYIMVDFGYGERRGRAAPDISQTYDMVIDYIRVRQKIADLTQIPSGFDALPLLSGKVAPGNRLTVIPKTSAEHVEYRWYRDGAPIIGEVDASYLLRADDSGHKIRCHVRALSLLDQPEAWTSESETVL